MQIIIFKIKEFLKKVWFRYKKIIFSSHRHKSCILYDDNLHHKAKGKSTCSHKSKTRFFKLN